jgi:hypothetical protein
MTEDLLTRIERELEKRIEELRGAVDEYDRLAGELSALQDVPAPPVDSEPPVVSEPPVNPEPYVDSEPLTNVVRFPARHESERTGAVSSQADRPMSPTSRPARGHVVSPKVARLMHAPRRPALERAGVVRVGAGRVSSASGDDLWPQDAGEEVGVEAELYEHSL